ncbi:TniQ family protein [Nonomuraea sp. NPDC052265]|uniref:TniQ family protein n=1 Tax=Nonomuraea sp. NPDC052265 TaxID=3364374 RepID=UPI0037CC9804
MRPGERVRRWPVHPPPHPGEALTSWLGRLASIYHLSPRQLLQHNLGPASTLLDDPPPMIWTGILRWRSCTRSPSGPARRSADYAG